MAAEFLSGKEARQQHEDAVVELRLRELMDDLRANGRIPADTSILFCDEPTRYGIPLSALAALEEAAYRNAGYQQRAEGQSHFDKVFRGYTVHGPLRYVILIGSRRGEASGGLVPLAFFDYFEASEHLDDDYKTAAATWTTRLPGVEPAIYIVSKLAADPKIPRRVAGLPGQTLITTLLALAESNPYGIFLEGPAQPASQRFIRGRMRDNIPGFEMLLDQPFEGEGAGGLQAKMIAYIPPPWGR